MAPSANGFWDAVERRCLSMADASCVICSFIGLCLTAWSHFNIWALQRTVSQAVFWSVSVINLIGGPLIVAILYAWTRRKPWDGFIKTVVTFSFSVLLTAIAGCAVLFFALERHILGDALLSECLMALCSCFAVCLLLRTGLPELCWPRFLDGKMREYKEPKITLCDDLESVAPGMCAICLQPLSDLDPECSRRPQAQETKAGRGLLRLPCQHTFHSACVEAWLSHHDDCPLCREKPGELRRCKRICVRHAPSRSAKLGDNAMPHDEGGELDEGDDGEDGGWIDEGDDGEDGGWIDVEL